MRYFAIHIILGLSLLLQIGALITQNAENVAGFLESNKFKAFSSLQDPSEFQNASPASKEWVYVPEASVQFGHKYSNTHMQYLPNRDIWTTGLIDNDLSFQLRLSRDGGDSWESHALVSHENCTKIYDPYVAETKSGILVTMSCYYEHIFITYRSTDGVSFGSPTVTQLPTAFLAVQCPVYDEENGITYLPGYFEKLTDRTTRSKSGCMKSLDDGLTWEYPVIYGEDIDGTGYGGNVAIGKGFIVGSGHMYAASLDTIGDLPYSFSFDHGATWSSSKVFPTTEGWKDTTPYLRIFGNNMLVSYNAQNGTVEYKSEMLFTRNFGQSFEKVTSLFDRPADTVEKPNRNICNNDIFGNYLAVTSDNTPTGRPYVFDFDLAHGSAGPTMPMKMAQSPIEISSLSNLYEEQYVFSSSNSRGQWMISFRVKNGTYTENVVYKTV